MALNWNGDEFGGSERLNSAQMSEAYRRFDGNMGQLEGFVRGRTTPSGENAVAALQRIVNEASARAPGGSANDAFRYGISQALLEKAGEMRNNPDQFVRYLDTVRERPNAWAFWEQTPLDPVFERAKQHTKAYVEQATGGPSEWKPFSVFKGQHGAHAFSGGALDALIDEAANTAQDVVRISANPLEASRQFGEMLRNVDKLPTLVKQQYQEAEKLIKASTLDDYHKGFLTAKTLLIALDVKDAVQTAGKLKHLSSEFKAGRINNIKDALDAFDQGAPRRARGDGADAPDLSTTVGARQRPRDTPNAANLPDDAPRTRLPNLEQARLVTQAFGIEGTLANKLSSEISEWSRRTGGRIEDLYNSPGVLYGSGSRNHSGLLGEAVMDAANVPYSQRKAGHIVLADMRERMPGASGPDLARAYSTMMPGGPQHARFLEVVKSVDKVLSDADAARWRNSPEGRKSLPSHQQADLLAEALGADGAFRTQLRREITAWAQGKPDNAIENLRNSGNVLVGDGTGARPTGLAGEAVLDMVSKDPMHRRAAQDVLREIHGELVPPGKSRPASDVLAVYESIANGNTPNRKTFDARVQTRLDELLVGTPEGRKTLPTYRQGDLLAESYGVDPGRFKDQIRREIHDWAQGKPDNAVENLRSSTTALFGDMTGSRPYGIVGEALLDTVSPGAKGPIHRSAAEAALSDMNRELFNGKNTYGQVMAAYEQITTPGTDWSKHFDSRLNAHRTHLLENTPEGRQTLPAAQQTALLMRYHGIEGALAPSLAREIETWAAATPGNKIENLRNSFGLLHGDGTGARPAGLIGEALADTVATPGNRKAVEAVIGDLRREAGDQGQSPTQLLERYEQIATPGTAARADFDQRVGRRQAELDATQRPTTETPRTEPPQTVTPPTSDAATPPVDRPPADRTPPTDAATPPGGNDKPPRDNTAAASAPVPEDPLIPGYSLPRSARMAAPAPIEGNGARYDFAGVAEDGRVRLRPQGDIARDVPNELMFQPLARNAQGQFTELGKTVNYDGEAYRFARFGPQDGKPGANGFHLEHPTDPARNRFVPESEAAKVTVGREVVYDNGREVKTWRIERFESPGWQPDVKERGVRLVDPDNPQNKVFVPDRQSHTMTVRLGADGETYRLGDMQHGVLRMRPAEPAREVLVAPWKDMEFEARLNGRELEGTKKIRVDDNGQWTATGPGRDGKVVTEAVRPGDVAPRWRDVYSPDFRGTFEVDAFALREAQTRSRAVDGAQTGLPLRDPNFRAMPETTTPRLNPGTASLDDQADFIRASSAALPRGGNPHLTVFNIAFNNQGDADKVLQAMVAFRERHPDAKIDLVAYKPSFDSFKGKPGFDELQSTLQKAGVEVKFMEGDGVRQVIHAKGVAVNDQVLFTTGAVIDGSRHKADISVPLSPEAGRTFRTYLDEAVLGNANPERRNALLSDLAQQGVLINDPVVRQPYIARAQDGLIRGADEKLFIAVSELQNPQTATLIAQQLADKPKLTVELQYREMDPKSREILDQAKARFGDRLDVQDVSQWQPRPHFNTIVADGKQAYVGTAYLWPNQQQMIHHGVSLENGVLLQGESVRKLQGQLDMLERLQPENPGLPRLNPARDNAPDVGFRSTDRDNGSVSISAPTGSSIGVDIKGGSVDAIQTASGNRNVQIAGDTAAVNGRDARADIHGNVQATDGQGIKITLQNPGTSGNIGTQVNVQGADVRGPIQSVIGNQNVQIDANQGQVSSSRQTIVDGNDNRQTQNLPADTTVGKIEQRVQNGNATVQQVGDAATSANVDARASQVAMDRVQAGQGTRVDSIQQTIDGAGANGSQVALQNVTAGGKITVDRIDQSISDGTGARRQAGEDPDRTPPQRSQTTQPDSTAGVPERKLGVVSSDPPLDGQSVPYTPRFNSLHGLTGVGDGRYTTISGHGKVELDGDGLAPNGRPTRASFQVPEGTTVHYLGLPGGLITDRLGQRADVGGDLSGVPMLKLGAGDHAPDILVLPANGTITIQGKPITVDKPEGVRLSELIREHGLTGNIVVSTCLEQKLAPGEHAKWDGILFDLPEKYPTDGSRGRTDARSAESPDAASQGNFFQRVWDKALDAQLPAVANLTVFASQSGPDSKWQAGIPVDAGAMVQKLQEYMANNVKGDSQASVDDVFKMIDPKRAADLKVGSSPLVGGVDFATGFQRLQTLQVAIDGANVDGGGLRWDDKVGAYQLKATAVDGGYRLDAPLTVKPSESLTPLNISSSRLSGEAGEALGLPSMSLKITDDYKAITLPAGTVLTRDNLDLINRALADPEYRSRAGTTDYSATAKASVALSEPRANANDPANLFDRVFARGEAGEFGKLEPAARKLEASVSPGVLGIDVHNPPLNSTRVGFEVETRPGPSVRELFEAGQKLLQGARGLDRTEQDLRSERPEASPVAATPALDPRAVALLADSRASLEDMNRRVGVTPPAQITETLVPELASRAYAAGFGEVARADLNAAVRQRDGTEIPAGTQLIASDASDRRVTVDIAEALRKTPEQAQAGLVAQVAQHTAQARDPALAPVAQEPERQNATIRIA